MKEEVTKIIKSKDLKNISIEVVEKIIDNQLSNDILREIPILKSLVAIKNIYYSYTDSIFIKKAMNVILELSEVSSTNRAKLIEDLTDEEQNGAEKLLMAIQKLDNIKKCKVFGRLCKLKANGIINMTMFFKLTKLIQDAYLDDLYYIDNFYRDEENEVAELDCYNLVTLGLIVRCSSNQEPITKNHERSNAYDPEFYGGQINFFYLLTELGKVFQDNYGNLFPDEV